MFFTGASGSPYSRQDKPPRGKEKASHLSRSPTKLDSSLAVLPPQHPATPKMNTTPYEGVFGLYYFHSSKPVTLPLVSVRATASLKDLVARVSLAQTYHNDSPHLIEATYTFPIPARGAVCSFQMVKEDGTKVVGLVQEKEEARRTYDSAVDEGKLASLMEQQSPDGAFLSVPSCSWRNRSESPP